MCIGRKLLWLLSLIECLVPAACATTESDIIPRDFKLVAHYGPGLSSWYQWKVTITGDGKTLQETYTHADNKERILSKTFSLTKEDIRELIIRTQGSRFSYLEKDYSPPYEITDCALLILRYTMNGKSQEVRVYAPEHVKDREEVMRFMKVWNEVLKKVPSP